MMRFTLIALAVVPASGSLRSAVVQQEVDGPSGSSFIEDVVAPVEGRRLAALGCKWHEVSVQEETFSISTDCLLTATMSETESCADVPEPYWENRCWKVETWWDTYWVGCPSFRWVRACVTHQWFTCPEVNLAEVADGTDDNCF